MPIKNNKILTSLNNINNNNDIIKLKKSSNNKNNRNNKNNDNIKKLKSLNNKNDKYDKKEIIKKNGILTYDNIENLMETVNEINKIKSQYDKKTKYQNKRLTLFPIQYPKIWEMFKKQQAHFWTTEAIDFSDDRSSYNLLPKEIRRFFNLIFATFNVLDSVVNDNVDDIKNDLPDTYLEADNFYYAQGFIEAIHMETYSTILDILIDNDEKDYWINIAKNAKFVKDKINNAIKYQGRNSPLEIRIIANGCVEGIGFCSLFPPIFWTKNLKNVNMIPGTRFANEEISIDEALHRDFASILYNDLIRDGYIKKLDTKIVHNIVDEYSKTEMSIAKYFYDEMLDKSIKYYKNLSNNNLSHDEINKKYYFQMFDQLNYNNVCNYIKFIADQYLIQLGYPILYGCNNPFPFMEKLRLGNKSNFFEKRVAEYSQLDVTNINNINKYKDNNNSDNNDDFDINYDF